MAGFFPESVAILVGAGLLAGFIAGLVGVGGGVIFAPVLFFWFSSQGMDPVVLAPLTIGSSLFCTCLVSVSAAWSQHARDVVQWRSAVGAGCSAAIAIFLMTRFVTTRPFYDATVFQLVFSGLLVFVGLRMSGLFGGRSAANRDARSQIRPGVAALVMAGSAAGIVSTAVGVGGGIVMVPMYERLIRMPIHRAVATSSATIVFISFWGVVGYVISGWGGAFTATSVGYVDFRTALFLVVPALWTARLGVKVSHAVNRVLLRRLFAGLSILVAVRLLIRVTVGV